MGSLNKVMVIGNLGADPEMKYLASGDACVNLSLATTDTWKDKNSGEKKEKTEWHRISFFGRPAEVIAEYCSKGSSLFVEGSLQTRTYEKEGQTHYATEIKGRNFQFLGGGQGQNKSGGTRPPADDADEGDNNPKPKQDEFDDDIPF